MRRIPWLMMALAGVVTAGCSSEDLCAAACKRADECLEELMPNTTTPPTQSGTTQEEDPCLKACTDEAEFFKEEKNVDCEAAAEEYYSCVSRIRCNNPEGCDIFLAAYQKECYSLNTCFAPAALLCDGMNDCDDGSDEFGCSPCLTSQFSCGTGTNSCVSATVVCDGIKDCANGQDESGCGNCSPSEFTCSGANECVPLDSVCDMVKDCSRGRDEVGCSPCTSAQFRCANSSCIASGAVCSPTGDCTDGSDEVGCP